MQLPTKCSCNHLHFCFATFYIFILQQTIVIELKWDKSAVGAVEQIKEKQYGNALKNYQGNLLLVGINYNKTTKKHECVIEAMQK